MKSEIVKKVNEFLMEEEVMPNQIQIINSFSEFKKTSLLKTIPQSIYVEDEENELDRYNEVHFYLKDGRFLQNAVEQEFFTKTIQGHFKKEGETIESAINRHNIKNIIESIILYTQTYKEEKEKVVTDTRSVYIINWEDKSKIVYN